MTWACNSPNNAVCVSKARQAITKSDKLCKYSSEPDPPLIALKLISQLSKTLKAAQIDSQKIAGDMC